MHRPAAAARLRPARDEHRGRSSAQVSRLPGNAGRLPSHDRGQDSDAAQLACHWHVARWRGRCQAGPGGVLRPRAGGVAPSINLIHPASSPATVGNRRQSPAPSHRKHQGSTFLPVTQAHALHGYGAPWGRRWEAQGCGLLGRRRRQTARARPARSKRRARRGAPRRS